MLPVPKDGLPFDFGRQWQKLVPKLKARLCTFHTLSLSISQFSISQFSPSVSIIFFVIVFSFVKMIWLKVSEIRAKWRTIKTKVYATRCYIVTLFIELCMHVQHINICKAIRQFPCILQSNSRNELNVFVFVFYYIRPLIDRFSTISTILWALGIAITVTTILLLLLTITIVGIVLDISDNLVHNFFLNVHFSFEQLNDGGL